MSVLYAIKGIKEIAKDIDKNHGCLPNDRKKWVKSYSFWNDYCNALADNNCNDELAYRLLADVLTDDDEYHVALQTVIDVVNIATNSHRIESDSDVEDYLLALDRNPSDTETVAKEVFDPEDIQLVGDESITRDCYRGTHQQWMEYLLDCDDWYRKYCDDLECDNPPTQHEWAEDQIKQHCTPWDGNMRYKPL